MGIIGQYHPPLANHVGGVTAMFRRVEGVKPVSHDPYGRDSEPQCLFVGGYVASESQPANNYQVVDA